MKNFGVGTLLHATVFRVAKNVKQADLKNIFLNQVKCMLAPFVTLGFSIKKKLQKVIPNLLIELDRILFKTDQQRALQISKIPPLNF